MVGVEGELNYLRKVALQSFVSRIGGNSSGISRVNTERLQSDAAPFLAGPG